MKVAMLTNLLSGQTVLELETNSTCGGRWEQVGRYRSPGRSEVQMHAGKQDSAPWKPTVVPFDCSALQHRAWLVHGILHVTVSSSLAA